MVILVWRVQGRGIFPHGGTFVGRCDMNVGMPTAGSRRWWAPFSWWRIGPWNRPFHQDSSPSRSSI